MLLETEARVPAAAPGAAAAEPRLRPAAARLRAACSAMLPTRRGAMRHAHLPHLREAFSGIASLPDRKAPSAAMTSAPESAPVLKANLVPFPGAARAL
jgi:hypothetical protein